MAERTPNGSGLAVPRNGQVGAEKSRRRPQESHHAGLFRATTMARIQLSGILLMTLMDTTQVALPENPLKEVVGGVGQALCPGSELHITFGENIL